MKHVFLLLSLCLVLSVQALYAQQDIQLPGVVVEQNSKYRTGKKVYLSNAEIKAAGATPQISDANGAFTLVFADRPYGDVTRIFATKNGYEVVNEEVLKQASIIGRGSPLQIVMCVAGQLYENQMAYYNIAKDASLAAYQRKMATLQKEGKEKDRLIAQLSVDFNQIVKTKEEAMALLDKQRQLAEKQAKEMADKWISINLDDESPTYQRAFAAFEAKDIARAKAILDSIDLEKRLALNSSQKAKEEALRDTLQNSINERTKEMRQDVQICLLKAQLHKLDYEWAKAEKYYDLALQYDEGNYDVTFEAAYFLAEQNQFTRAINYYQKALAQAREDNERATVLNNLGALLYANNEMSAAKKHYQEALQLYRQLATKNPDAYLPDVATTLNNLGNLLKNNNEMSVAKTYIEEALQITRQLATKNPDAYLPDVATTLNNLGALLSDNNEMSAAKTHYEEALQIR
ncbi:MAG TPA: tetratricopeptide repeat protein, partial [Chitinophagales bacterium]|nr:tetratricopeptide repeat protein [Chitinophagales bacterium]